MISATFAFVSFINSSVSIFNFSAKTASLRPFAFILTFIPAPSTAAAMHKAPTPASVMEFGLPMVPFS